MSQTSLTISVGGNSSSSNRSAKLFHRKSRTGCVRCRTRRVKCNEAKPVCANCERHQMPCVYDRLNRISALENETSHSDNTSDGDSKDAAITDLPESRSRRMLELRLLHDYMTRTAPTLGIDDYSKNLWERVMPELAFQSDALLYAICAMTAIHSARLEPDEDASRASMDIHRRYMAMAAGAHQLELSPIDRNTVDNVCMTAMQLRIIAFAVLQGRSLSPYTPPLSWLQMWANSGTFWLTAINVASDNLDSWTINWVRQRSDPLHVEIKGTDENRQDISYLFHRTPDDILHEPWDDETEQVYRATLNFIGGISKLLKKNNNKITPRIALYLTFFPIAAPRYFVTLLEQMRPRALVTLAHYFALLDWIRGYWYIGNIGERETHAIATKAQLPPRWRDLMEPALKTLETHVPFGGEPMVRELEN